MDSFNRWSQIVRTPGAVEIASHHQVEVPGKGDNQVDPPRRPGVRLLVRPLTPGQTHSTIDVTSSAAIAMLDGFLTNGIHIGKSIGWRATGFGRRRRDTIHITPIGQAPVKV